MRDHSASQTAPPCFDELSAPISGTQVGVSIAAMGVIVASSTVAGALIGFAAVGCALGIALFSTIVLAALMI